MAAIKANPSKQINPVPQSISKGELEQSVCRALSLTGTTAKPDDIHVCLRMKNKEKIIIKIKHRKQRNKVVFKRKELKSETAEHYNLDSSCL